jgi:hypothetical protein
MQLSMVLHLRARKCQPGTASVISSVEAMDFGMTTSEKGTDFGRTA